MGNVWRKCEEQIGRQRQAVQAFNANPASFAEAAAGDTVADEACGNGPHITHDLRQMLTHPITYCNTCAHFAWHGTHSKLRKPCEPILKGNKTSLRLLQCDIVPKKGAKLPLHLRKRAWAPGEKRQ